MASKKKSKLTPTLKALIVTVIVVPVLVGFRGHICSIWAAPEKVEKVEKKVMSNEETSSNLSKLVVEQEARIEMQEKVSALQIEALKEQLSIVSELRKRK